MTYGDGISNVDLNKLLRFHKKHNKIATLTAVRPIPRFGNIKLNKNKISEFSEKDRLQEGWINGGYFVLNPKVIDRIEGDQTSWEGAPLSELVSEGELSAFQHDGFWQPMDTLREKILLNNLWNEDKAPWKTW